jgi:peptidoglycan hydrolase-like protein with peptidoglycan-binding domain
MRAPRTRDWESRFREVSKASRGTGPARAQTAAFGAAGQPTVAELQSALNAHGASPPLVVDGSMGPKTHSAIASFQASHTLPATGQLDPVTLAGLGFQGATSVSPGHPGQTVLPSTNTPLSPADAAKALSAGYQKATGNVPTPDVLNLLLAQTALETASWTRMPSYNFGGTKAQASDPYIQVFDTTEVVNGVTTPMKQTFGAYKTAADGAYAYVRTVLSRPNWAQGLHSGTPEGFVAGLSSPPAYFTADPSSYLSGLKNRASQYLAVAEQYAVPIGVGVAGIALVAGLAGAGVALARSRGWA